jgi:hypothetical protein
MRTIKFDRIVVFKSDDDGDSMTLRSELKKALSKPWRQTQGQSETLFAKEKMILPESREIPSFQMLTKMLLLAQRNLTRSIELTWTLPESHVTYALNVRCVRKELLEQKATGEFLEVRWHLTQSRSQAPQKSDKLSTSLWVHATSDVGVIVNLLWFGTTPLAPIMSNCAIRNNDRNIEGNSSKSPPHSLVLLKSIDQQRGFHTLASSITLAGRIGEIEIADLLQSIAICKFTGRLDFIDDLQYNLVFFESGKPVHAAMETTLTTEFSPIITGDLAILDLPLWQSGRFKFNMGETTSERTVKSRLETLLLQAACLKDAQSALENAGITDDSVLCPLVQPCSEEEFKKIVDTAAPLAVQPQKQFFDLADSHRTVKDIGSTLGWNRVKYLPFVFNLFKTGLIGI